MASHTFIVNPDDDYRPACSTEEYSVHVPKNLKENRNLKYGHVEDDNIDIAYLNFPILKASGAFTIFSLTTFIFAIYAAWKTDYKPLTDEELLDNSLIVRYGGKPFRCKTFLKFPVEGLPSIVNLLELNVYGNIIFRFATILTIAVRIFQVMILRKLITNWAMKDYKSPVVRWFTDLMPMISGMETTSLALFSIITTHNDFKDINHFAKSVFALTSCANMFLISVFSLIISINSSSMIGAFSVLIRIACTMLFTYTAPQYFQFHIGWTKDSLCHSYIPYDNAIQEYCLIFAYLAFYLACLYDLSNVYFICYPRSCSGECEPLKPDNYEKGAKYEHCRAFEYNQRRIRELSTVTSERF